MSAPGWIARLEGREKDLTACERLLELHFDPKIELVPHNGNLIRALRSRKFDALRTATEVRTEAETLLARLNGALRLAGNTDPLTFGDVGYIENDGSIHFTTFAEARLQLEAMVLVGAAEVRNPDGSLSPSPPPAPSLAQKWLSAAEKDDDLARVLKYFGAPTNWYDMWTAYEIIEDELFCSTPRGLRPKPRKGMKPKRALLMSRQWVLESEFTRFAESCNYHRHGAKKAPTPDQSATREEARQVLAQIFRGWLATKGL